MDVASRGLRLGRWARDITARSHLTYPAQPMVAFSAGPDWTLARPGRLPLSPPQFEELTGRDLRDPSRPVFAWVQIA